MPAVPKLPGRSPERPGSSAPGRPRRYKQAPKAPKAPKASSRLLRAAVAVIGSLVLVGAIVTAYALEPTDDGVSAASSTNTTESPPVETPTTAVTTTTAWPPITVGPAPDTEPEPDAEPEPEADLAEEPEPEPPPEGSAAERLAERRPTLIVPPKAQAAPVAIDVPVAGVSAPIDPLGIDTGRRLEVPQDYSRVGWWSGGASPGEQGPAVLVGHLDTTTAPAVFHDLDKLNPGDEVHVTRSDDSVATFMVERIESFPKTMFPTTDVYGSADESSLRLVTCYGSFDEAQRSYQDNLIVYANLVS